MKPLVGMGRTLGFGLVAALAVIPWQLVLGSVWAQSATFAAYALLCACAFPLAIAPNLRAAFGACVASAALSAAAWLVSPAPSASLLAAALIVALTRMLCYRAQPARALALELALLVLSLGAARLFGGHGPFGLALGMWAYFLVQSAYFLFLRPEPRNAEPTQLDAFDEAHHRALALIERR